MSCKIQLNSKFNSFKIELRNENNDLIENIYKGIVYQNQPYEFIVYIDEDIEEIYDIELFINNESINYRFNAQYEVLQKGIYKFSSQFWFSTIFGFADISIEITYENQVKKYYYSDYISVAIDKNNESELLSIKQMIEYIYDKNVSLLYSSSIDRVSNISSGTENSGNRSIDTEIILLNQIIAAYNINLRYFMNDLKYKMVSHNEIDDLRKLKKIDNNTIRFIAANPEQLAPVNYLTGIKYNYQNYEPLKTLVSRSYFCYNIYENQVVIGFLKYLINECKNKINKVKKILNDNQKNVTLSIALEKNYILSSEIVYKYSRITMVKYINKIGCILDNLQKIYFNYKNIMKCEEIIINKCPKPTNIFISINHYRNIFNVITKWFSQGNYDITKNKDILSFLTADEIYEYYCLLNIIQLIKKFNFIEDESNRKKYEYKVPNNLYSNTKVNNTFYFFNEDKRITIYFQPVIYSYNSSTRNNITLFRTDSNNNYFVPDFVIKLEKKNCESKYAIFDSKWSKYKTIEKYRLNEATLKYLLAIRNEENLKQVNLMWLLQGRDDENKNSIFYFNKGEISRKLNNFLYNSSGIVKVTPKSGMINLEQILEKFIE